MFAKKTINKPVLVSTRERVACFINHNDIIHHIGAIEKNQHAKAFRLSDNPFSTLLHFVSISANIYSYI